MQIGLSWLLGLGHHFNLPIFWYFKQILHVKWVELSHHECRQNSIHDVWFLLRTTFKLNHVHLVCWNMNINLMKKIKNMLRWSIFMILHDNHEVFVWTYYILRGCLLRDCRIYSNPLSLLDKKERCACTSPTSSLKKKEKGKEKKSLMQAPFHLTEARETPMQATK